MTAFIAGHQGIHQELTLSAPAHVQATAAEYGKRVLACIDPDAHRSLST
jgi:hypothetical protein